MGVKIIDLNQAPGLQGADVFPISQDIAGNRETKRVTIQQLTTYLNYIPNPSVVSNGQVLTYDDFTSTWIAKDSGVGNYITKPTNPTHKQVLTYDNNTNKWVGDSLSNIGFGVFIPNPESAINKQILTYDGSNGTWVASNITNIGDDIYITKPTNPTHKQVLTYDNSTSTWSSSSLSSVGFMALLSSNGYQKLPSGLIMQWGSVLDVSGDTSVSIRFPINFPNLAFNVVVSFNYSGEQVDHSQAVNTRNITFSGFVSENQWHTADFPIKTGNIYWQAFGY